MIKTNARSLERLIVFEKAFYPSVQLRFSEIRIQVLIQVLSYLVKDRCFEYFVKMEVRRIKNFSSGYKSLECVL